MKKKFLIVFISSLFSSLLYSQYTSIPDGDFEQALIDLNIDSDGLVNAQVLTSDINIVGGLYIDSNNLHNIIGIENFTALISLDIDNCNNLTNLDLSGNPNLLSLKCLDNSLTNINISNNPLLLSISCIGNELTTIDFSNNINLISIYCDYNNMTSIDVSNNSTLSELICSYNQLTSLNISNKPWLNLLSCNNNLLTSLTLTNVPQFARLHCENNQLTNLNTNGFPSIKNLFCYNNLLTELNLTNNLQISVLFCGNNSFSNLNLNNNSLLNILSCTNSNLLTLEIQNGTNNLLNGTYPDGVLPNVNHNRFDSTGNPNLHCIFVDNVTICNYNWLGKETTSTYVNTQAQCDAALLATTTFKEVNYIVFPNPTKDFVTINFGSNQENVTITLLTVLGQEVSSKTYNQISATTYPIMEDKGLYFLEIENNKYEKKIIKVLKE